MKSFFWGNENLCLCTCEIYSKKEKIKKLFIDALST
jgi:hypothetical protein